MHAAVDALRHFDAIFGGRLLSVRQDDNVLVVIAMITTDACSPLERMMMGIHKHEMPFRPGSRSKSVSSLVTSSSYARISPLCLQYTKRYTLSSFLVRSFDCTRKRALAIFYKRPQLSSKLRNKHLHGGVVQPFAAHIYGVGSCIGMSYTSSCRCFSSIMKKLYTREMSLLDHP